MAGRRYNLLTVFIIVTCRLTDAANDECPSPCFCQDVSKIVYCARKGLTRIPQVIPSGYEQLNVNNNYFESSRISRANLTNLVGLRHLYMSDCGIEHIAKGTFSELRQLEWLDLSSNRIRVIEDDTFHGSNLAYLFLKGNRNLQLRPKSFAGLSVSGLYLDECSLKTIPLAVLRPIRGLNNLWLNSNELTGLDEDLKPFLETLTHIRLTSNPFHCNCETKWLKRFYDANPEKFQGAGPPACLTPLALKGQPFDELDKESLICQPPMLKNVDAVLSESREGVLRCSATGDPAPTLFWVQPSGHADIYKPAKNGTFNEALLNISAVESGRSDLTGSYFCIAKNDAGNVTLNINVTWPAGSPRQLTSSQAPPTTTPPHVISLPPKRVNFPERESTISSTPQPVAISPDSEPKVPGPKVASKERRFSLGELIGAVVGTFVSTLLICLLIIPFVVRRFYKRPSQSPSTSPRHRYNNGAPKTSQANTLPFYPGQNAGLTPRDIAQTYTFEPNHYDSLGSYSKR